MKEWNDTVTWDYLYKDFPETQGGLVERWICLGS